jgi:hypothetical protein
MVGAAIVVVLGAATVITATSAWQQWAWVTATNACTHSADPEHRGHRRACG